MPQTQVDIPGVGIVEFPDTMGQADIDAAARKLYEAERGEMKWPPTEPAPPPGLGTRMGRAMQEPGRESLISPSPGLTPVERANLRAAQQQGGPNIREKPGGFRPPQEETQRTAFEPLISLEPYAQKYYPTYEGIALPEQAERGFMIGMARIIEGFSSPASLITIGAAGGLGALSHTLRVLITMGFSGMMGAEAIIKAPEIVNHVKAGEYDEAFAAGTETLVMGGMAVGLGGSAVKSGRSHPWWTGREMILDPRGPGGRGRPLEPRVFEEGAGLEVLPAHEGSLFPGRAAELPGGPATGALAEVPRQPRPGVAGVPSTQGIYQRGTPPEPGVRGLLPEAPGYDIPGAGPGRLFRGGARMGEPAPTIRGEPTVTGEQTVTPTGRPRGLFGDELSNVERQQRLAPDFVGPPEPPVRPELGPPLLTTQELQLPPGGGGGVIRAQPPGEPGTLGPFRQGDIVPQGRPGVPARVREPGRFRVREPGEPSSDLLTDEPTVRPEGPITPEVLPPEATAVERRGTTELTFAPEGEGGAFVWEPRQLKDGEWGAFRDGDIWATRPTEAEAVDYIESRPTSPEIKTKTVKPPKSRWEVGQEWYKEGSMERAIVDEGGMKLDMKVQEEADMVMPNLGARRDARMQNMFDPVRTLKGEGGHTPDQMFHILQDNQVIPKNWTQSDFMQAMSGRTPGSKGQFPLRTPEDVMETMDAQAEALTPPEFRAEVPEPVRPEVPGRVVPETPRGIGEPPRTTQEADADFQRGRQQIEEMRQDPNYAGTDFEKLEVDNSLQLQRNLDRIKPPKPTTIGPGFGPEPDLERLRKGREGRQRGAPRPEVGEAAFPGGAEPTVTPEGEPVSFAEGKAAYQERIRQVEGWELDLERAGEKRPPTPSEKLPIPPDAPGGVEVTESAEYKAFWEEHAAEYGKLSDIVDRIELSGLERAERTRAEAVRTEAERRLAEIDNRSAEIPDAGPRPVEPTVTGEGLPEGWEVKQTQISMPRGDWGAYFEGKLQRRKHSKQAAEVWARDKAAQPPGPEGETPRQRLARKREEAAEAVEGFTGFEARAERQELIDKAERDQRAGPDVDLELPPERPAEPTVTPEGPGLLVKRAEGFNQADGEWGVFRRDPSGKEALVKQFKTETDARWWLDQQGKRKPPTKAAAEPEAEPTVTAEGQVEIVGHEGFKRESRLADDKAKLEQILTARPRQDTPAGRKQIIELGKRERALRKSIAEQERALRAEGDIEQVGMFAEEEPPLFVSEPTPKAELPKEETAGLYAEEPKVKPEGKPPEPLQTPLTTYEIGNYRVERTAVGEYDIYLEGKKVKHFRYRTDATQWADKEFRKAPPPEQPELAEPPKPPEGKKKASAAGDKAAQDMVESSERRLGADSPIASYLRDYLDWRRGIQKFKPELPTGVKNSQMAKNQGQLIDSLLEIEPEGGLPGGSTLYSNPVQPALDWWSKRAAPKIWKYLFSTKEPYGLVVKPWPEPLKWLFINRHGQAPTWVERHREWQRKTEQGAVDSFKLGQESSRKLSQEDQQLLGDLLGGRASEAELRAMRDNPEWQTAIDAIKTARSKFDEYAALAAEQKLLSQENFFKNHGKYMPRLYRRYEVDYDAQLRKWGAKKPTRLDQDRYKARQDIPEEVRILRGEILEPGYPIAKGLAQVIHDVETSKLFNFVADNGAWTVSPERMVELGKDPKKYTLMPETSKLGRLSGQYVDKYIASELNQMTKARGEVEKVSKRLVSEWKFNKVIFNPATHGRNMISNTMLAYLSGLPPWRVDIYAKAMKELYQQKGDYYQAAKDAGLFSTTFAKGELAPLIDSWNSSNGGIYDRIAGMSEKFAEGNVAEGLGRVLPSGTRAGQRAAKIYQGEEAWFKLAKYIQEAENGATPKQAAAAAQKALFDYTEVPPFVSWARTSPLGAPFLTFTYKALPQILETGLTHPWRLGSLVYGIYALEEAARKEMGIDEDQMAYLQRIMPDRMKGEPLGLGPKALLLPFVDKYDQLQYLDLTYILPWGDIGETGATGIYQGSPIHAAPMRAIYEISLNKSAFTGQEIWNENDSKLVVTQKISDHLYKWAMPSLAPPVPGVTEGGYGFERIWKSVWGKEDYFGRVSAPTTAIASAIIGLKTNPLNPDIELFFRQKEFEDGFDEITAAAYKVQNHQGLSEEEKITQLDELRKRMTILRQIAQDTIFGPEQEQELQPQQPAPQQAPPPGLPQGEPQVQPEQ